MTYMEQDDLDFLLKRLHEQYIESKFEFLNEHKGIRTGHLHMLIGTTGSGKSTLLRSILLDSAYGKKIVVWLSEETKQGYAIMLNSICRDKKILDNIILISEQDVPERLIKGKYADNFLFYFKEEVMKHSPDILFIDNITTSYMYSDVIGFVGQSHTSTFLRNFSADQFLPIFMVAHTRKNVMDNDNKLIDISDIKGSSSISNTCAYAYALQVFRNGAVRFPIISIQKHRYHEIKNKFFMLHYQDGLYTRSTPINNKIVNDLFQLRDKLTDVKNEGFKK